MPDRRRDRSVVTHVRPGWDGQPNLLVNPGGDPVFTAHARRVAAQCHDPAELQGALRRHYPGAVVRRRELSGEAFELWYVYRDGHWSPPER